MSPRAGRARRAMITYPTGFILGVLDDPSQAPRVGTALTPQGIEGDGFRVLVGDEGRDRLGRLGPKPNALSRVVRVFQFMLMDQTPDFLVYEQALVDGRAVLAVRPAEGREAREAARATLDRAGVHFCNWYGRFMTEELSMWRGPEPDIPDALRR